MNFDQPIAILEIAKKYKLKIIGDTSLVATGINEIHKVRNGDITFVDYEKYYSKSLNSAASIIIIDKEVECPAGKAIMVCDNPFLVYDDIIRTHRPFIPLTTQIHPTAVIDPSAIIEPNVVIGPYVQIGANTHVQAGAIIHEHCHIGNDVLIQSGALIGTDAFYFQKKDGQYNKWRSGGRVIIGNKADIGSGCTLNRGVSGDTIVGEGTKLDSQVHLGHGVEVGKHCLIAAHTAIAGKSIIGDNCVIYGQVGIAQGVKIGDGAVLLAKSGVSKDIEGGITYYGVPVDKVRTKYREMAAVRQLPDFMKKNKK